MARKHLCFDIDNVLAQTDQAMRKVIREFTRGRVDLEYEHVIDFAYYECKDAGGNSITRGEWAEIHELFSEPEILLTIQPFTGVQANLRHLSEEYEIHFATSRLPKARRTTIEWLERHAFPAHNLHFLKHGKKHESLCRLEAAVEDEYEQARAYVEIGIPCYLIKHPWNANKPSQPNLFWVVGWPELVKQLMFQ